MQIKYTETEKHSAHKSLYCQGCKQFVGLLLKVAQHIWRCPDCK